MRKNKPHFLIVECFRWMEHVGVGYDWDLGYRNDKELDYWKKFDIETNPEIWSSSKELIEEINLKVKKEVDALFKSS